MAGRGSRIFALAVGAVYEGVNELDNLSNVRWLLSNCPKNLFRCPNDPMRNELTDERAADLIA
jgi:hypothetical protein